jgi:hypothetical protein
MDKLEMARQMFQELERRGVGSCSAANIARRQFLIEDNLSAIRG